MNKAFRFLAFIAIGAVVYTSLPEVQAAAAMGSIRGVIKDSQGNPLIGASVFVLAETAEAQAVKIIKRASTDKEGKFTAAGLIPGHYLLKAEAVGFAPIAFAADVQPRKVIVFDSILMRREGTLAERTRLNLDPKFAARRSRGSIFHYDENKAAATPADDETIALTPRSAEMHGYVNAFNQTAVSPDSDTGSMTGANFAVSQQIGRDANVIMSGQIAHGSSATQRFEVLTTGHAGDKHKLGLALGYARFTFSRASKTPQIGQFSLSASDTWQVAGPVLVVYGLEFARFTEGAAATSVLPKFGVSVDAGARTRIFAGLTPGSSVDEQAKINLESGEIVFSQPKAVALSKEGAPLTDSSYRLQVGAERILSDKSSVEMMAFFDTVSGHGVGLLAIPVERVEDQVFQNAQQKGRSRGLRLVYNRRINSILNGSIGYAFGEGQQLDENGISDPAHLFSNSAFQIVSAKINANFISTGTQISTVLRLAPARAVFAIDPFEGQIATYDPNISISLSQALPNLGFLPGQLEALVDVRNLLDQQASVADDRQQLISSRFNRLVRVGVSMRF
jgi:hypothetical protein